MNAFYSMLNTFFRNFDKKNWSSALLKGKLEFRDLLFNEVVIHQLLELPPHTILKRMTCDELKIKASWTKLGSKPIEVHVGTITMELVEAPTLRKPPRIAQIEPPPPGQYKRSFTTGIVENMNISIAAIRITFQPLGADEPHPPLPMHISLENVSMRVADSHYSTRVNLPELISAAKQLAAQHAPVVLYRVALIERIAIAFGEHTVLDRSSVTVRVAATLSPVDGHLEGATIAVDIDRLAFSFKPVSADALLFVVEQIYWLKKKPYSDTTVRCVTLPTHPPPRDVEKVVEPSDAGVVLADDPEYAKKYGRLIPNRKSRFEPLFEKTWKVDVNIGIINFEWSDDDAAAQLAAEANASSGCVVSINRLNVQVYFNDRPLPPDAAEAAARKRLEFLAGKQRVIEDRAEARRADEEAPTSAPLPAPSAATRARAESLEQAALARRAALEQRVAVANAAAVEDDAALRLRREVADVLAEVDDLAELEREQEIAAAHGKPLPPMPGAPPLVKKKSVAKKAVKWTAKVTKTATKATVKATGRAIRAVNPMRAASKRDVHEPAAAPAPAVSAAPAAKEAPQTPTKSAAVAAAVSPATRTAPQPPPKVLPAAAAASVGKRAPPTQSSPAALTAASKSVGGGGDDDDEDAEVLKQLARGAVPAVGKSPRGKSDGAGEADAVDSDWLMVEPPSNEPARTVQVASGKEYRDDRNEKWRAELTDATVRVNVTLALLTIRDSSSPLDTSTYLLQPLMDEKTRRPDAAVSVKLEVELGHDEHLAVDVGVTLAPMVLRAEASRWAAVSAAVMPRAVRPPPWLPPSDPDEFDHLNVMVRLLALRVTLPPALPNVTGAHGLIACTLRDVGVQLIDHERAQFNAAAFPDATSPALPSPGLGLKRLCLRAGAQSVSVVTRHNANDDAEETASDSALFDSAPIALAATLESWRALLRWSGEGELIERELMRRAAEDDDSDTSLLLALVPDVNEALRDICHARVVLVAQQWHATVDLASYERASSVLASYVKKPAAAAPAASAASVAERAAAPTELSLIRAVPIRLDLDASINNISIRLRLRDDEHLPWVLEKPPAAEPPAAPHADRQTSVSGASAVPIEATTWDPLSPAAPTQSTTRLAQPTQPTQPQPQQRKAPAVAAVGPRRDVFLLRVQHVGLRVNSEALPVPERRAQVRFSVLRPHFECGRKVTAAPLGIVVSPSDLVDERALLRKETRASEVWLSLDCPLRVRDTGSPVDAPVATVDFQRAGDGTAELGVVGLGLQLHVLERDDSDVLGGAPQANAPASAFVSEHIKPDDFLQLSDVVALNALMRRLAGTDAAVEAAPAASGAPADLSPLSVELMLSDCDARVYNRRGKSAQVDDERLVSEVLTSALTAIGAQRLARLRLDGGGEIARRQRAKTSLLLAEQPLVAPEPAAVAAAPSVSSEVEIERDALRKTVNDLRHELEVLRIERETLSRQLRVVQAATPQVTSESDRMIIGSLQEMIRDLSIECANRRVEHASN